ncbi:FdxN element excision controlling factor protein [Tolypothrix bouteillei VB521301]|uniref:FdxN element excision controlling factor protein n=3 Tax=Nostocales TaxID=1161 RepID=A0A0C1R7S7_9CYAN|nr:FdxN element excision controlling factor protein [Tolypothrix bouteillei VB521301]
MEETEPGRQLYLAIRKATYREIFSEPIGSLVIKKNSLHLLIFDPQKETIAQWID